MGSILALRRSDKEAAEYPYRAMHRLAEQHRTRAMTVGLGTDLWVVLSGLDEIKKFSMSDEATFRPEMHNLNEIYAYGKNASGVIFPDGDLWREQRRFMVSQ